jgi:conjugative relaxase-like TrwC/TraI family protein
MLSVAAIGSSGAASSYYTKDNYYTADAAQETSLWAGDGAEKAGLAGEVGIEEFKAILDGKMPDGTELGAGNSRHRAGFDLTFSAPKTLSMLAYIGGDERLLEANMKATKATIAWVEKNLAETRMKGADGKIESVKTGNLVVALFQHDTNRNQDPQAHIHAVIANATQGPDGKWRALWNGKIWQAYSTIASVYNAQLRTEVEKLGYAIEPTGKHGQFEISGISRDAVMAFSTRRAEVLEAFSQLTHQNDQTRDAVTIKTRARKPDVENRAELRAEWKARALALGLDLPAMVEAARSVARDGKDAWGRVVEAARNGADGLRRVLEFIKERAGGSEQDPLMPKTLSKLMPVEIAAAKSVASAIRSLSEREAAFDAVQLTKTALDLGLPITVDEVEKRVTALERQGKLVRGVDGSKDRLTTPQAIDTEKGILAFVEAGRGKGDRVIDSPQAAGERLQVAAMAGLTEKGGFALNPGQEAAGRLVLAGTDRIVAVQGVAGAGKSSALGAMALVAREEGRNVVGLGLQNTLVRMLERDTGIASMTIARFLGSHGRLLDDRTSPQRLDMARAMFRGSILLVDEASMVSNDQVLKLTALAQRLEVGKLAFVGDKRQLGAIDAGKPFEVLQAAKTPTAEMNINLRARSAELKIAAAAANDYRPADALAALKDMTTEAPGRGAEVAAERWLALSPEIRESTMLLASGRQVRADINAAVQQGLLEQGAVQGQGLGLRVLDKVTTTREEERYIQTYAAGQRVDFQKGVPTQNIPAGTMRVTRIDRTGRTVELVDEQGRLHRLNPEKLATNRTENSVRITREKPLKIYEGDKVRWTDTDRDRGLINADRATVLKIDAAGVTFETSTKMQITLPPGDPMLQRLDLGYALNAHMAQGLTADRGIAVFDSREHNLTNEKLFLVNITRVRDSLELIVDSGARVERGIARNAGEKTSALETTGEVTIDRHGRAPGRQGPIAPTPPASPPQQPGPQGPRPPGISPDRTPDPSTQGRPVFPEREAPPEQYNVPLPERQRDWGL